MAKDRFDIKEREGVSFATDAIVIVDKETGVNYLSFIVATVADLLRSLIPTVNPSSPRTDIRNNGRSPYGLRPLLLKSPLYWMAICLTASFFTVTSFFGR